MAADKRKETANIFLRFAGTSRFLTSGYLLDVRIFLCMDHFEDSS